MCDAGRDGGVKLEFAFNGDLGHRNLGLFGGVAHLIYIGTLAGTEGGVAEEGYLGIYTEDFCALDGLRGNFHQFILGGIDVDGAVCHCQHHVAAGGGGPY